MLLDLGERDLALQLRCLVMRNLTFYGIFRSEDRLLCVDLPKGAHPLREPDSFAKVNLVAMGICLPLIILLVAAVAVSQATYGALPFKYPLQLRVVTCSLWYPCCYTSC